MRSRAVASLGGQGVHRRQAGAVPRAFGRPQRSNASYPACRNPNQIRASSGSACSALRGAGGVAGVAALRPAIGILRPPQQLALKAQARRPKGSPSPPTAGGRLPCIAQLYARTQSQLSQAAQGWPTTRSPIAGIGAALDLLTRRADRSRVAGILRVPGCPWFLWSVAPRMPWLRPLGLAAQWYVGTRLRPKRRAVYQGLAWLPVVYQGHSAKGIVCPPQAG